MLRVQFLTILVISVMLSALSVIDAKHKERKMFLVLQQAQQERDDLNEEWHRLQLEQSSIDIHARIEKLAHEKLGMYRPRQSEIKVLIK